MKLLLDTHIWIWSVLEPGRLGRGMRQELLAADAQLWLSPISIWELILLREKGRFRTEPSLTAWLEEAHGRIGWHDAPFTPEVAIEASRLQLPHRDPSDRLLLATALTYGLTLATADEKLLALPGFHFLPNR